MSEASDDEKFARVAQKVDPQSKFRRAWALTGGVSARVTALEIERADGRMLRMVVRQYGAVDLQQNPHIAADEFRLLKIVQAAGLAAPAPYFYDEFGDIFRTPYVVVEYIDGQPDFAPINLADHLCQLAAYLANIHTVDDAAELSFLPQTVQKYAAKISCRPEKLDELIDEGRIRAALEAVWEPPQRNKSVLLHGDFWSGNVLWRGGALVAVIDWEDAEYGDPLADFARTRLEILWALGGEAMLSFTREYQALTSLDYANLPYWDLCAALRPAFKISEWAADAAAEKTMRERHQWFVAQAFDTLAPP